MTFNGDLLGTGGFHDVMVNLLGSGGLNVTVSSRIDLVPPWNSNCCEYTSEALVAQYLHGT
jgi:hypothetical protein